MKIKGRAMARDKRRRVGRAMNRREWKKLKAVVFDFDGTLAELHLDFPEMKRRLRILAQEYFGEVLQTPQIPALEWLESLAVSLHQRDETAALELEERAGSLIKEIELEAAYRGALFPFTRSILQELQRGSIEVAIITRNCEEAVRIVFPDLDQYCRRLLARDRVLRVKPDPEHLLRALRGIAVSPEAALMVGDHPLDMQTGKRAGTLTAGVWSGNASEQDLIRAGADVTARNCEELMMVLKACNLL
jgi:phosphoglycolate phosphatase